MRQKKLKRLLAFLCILTLIPISSFGSKAEEEGQTELVNWSIRDVFMTDGNYGFEFDNNRAGIPNETLENTRFSTIFRLDALEDADQDNDIPPYINFWVGEQDHGLVLQMLDPTGATLNLIWIDAYGETLLYETVCAENIGLLSFYGVDIRMDVEMISVEEGTQVILYFFGEPYMFEVEEGEPTVIQHVNDFTYSIDRNVYIDRYDTFSELYLQAPYDLEITEDKILTPKAYDLSKGTYFLTGHNIMVNDVERWPSEELTDPGNYILVSTDASTRYTQALSLYLLGDVDLNRTQGDWADYVALRDLIATETYASGLLSAESFAGDLNNDGMLTLADLDLLDEIVTYGIDKLNEVIDRYHVPCLSYDFLGGDDVMPIVGFWGPNNPADEYGENSVTSEVYQLIKESGVNLINYSVNGLGVNPDPYTLASMKMAEDKGIGYFVSDISLNPEMDETSKIGYEADEIDLVDIAVKIGRYSYLDNFMGINLRDEPMPDEIQYYDDISNCLNRYVNLNGFLNALPASVIKAETNVAYADYIAAVKDTGAKVLSFDHYPFSGDADINHSENMNNYFTSLNEVQRAAKGAGIPFWGYVAAGGDWRDEGETGSTNSSYLPTKEETYWSVNTLLTFGAKGIEWFPLIQPVDFSYIDESARDANRNGMIGVDNETTPFYDYAKYMNVHIEVVDEVLMKAKNTGIMASSQNTKNTLINAGVSLIEGTDILKSVAGGWRNNYGALVGCFEYKNTEAFYVMNYDVTENGSQDIILTLDKTRNYTLLSGATVQEVIGEDNTIELSLGSGEAMLVVMWDESELLVGDTDGDLNVTEMDIPYLRSYLIGVHWCKAVVANINGDGCVDVRDIVRLKKQFMVQQE